VGYAWGRNTGGKADPALGEDTRWRQLHRYLKRVHLTARRKWVKRWSDPQSGMDDDEDLIEKKIVVASLGAKADGAGVKGGKKPEWPVLPKGAPGSADYRPEIHRLRAASGSFLWLDISRRIREADILVFDLTPREGGSQSAPNVLLELGAALSGNDKPVFIVLDPASSHRRDELIPSDLQGLTVGIISGGEKTPDRSLYSALTGAILRRANQLALTGGDAT
jgi:hypothetical protein